VQSPSWEANNKICVFWNSELHSCIHKTGTYPESPESNPHPHTVFKSHFNVDLPNGLFILKCIKYLSYLSCATYISWEIKKVKFISWLVYDKIILTRHNFLIRTECIQSSFRIIQARTVRHSVYSYCWYILTSFIYLFLCAFWSCIIPALK
jgi:hypothetical protein